MKYSTALVAVAAFHHPDEAFALALRRRLRVALKVKGTTRREGRLREAFARHRGTELSPFYLSEKNAELAVLLAEACFRAGSTRFRVTSEDLIGPASKALSRVESVVLTDRGNSFMPDSEPSGRFPTFYPGRTCELEALAVSVQPARLSVGDKGFELRVRPPVVDGAEWGLEGAQLAVGFSGVGSRKASGRKRWLETKGDAREYEMEFLINEEADVIRMLAACELGSVLRLSADFRDPLGKNSELRYRLEYPEEPVSLQGSFFAGLEDNRWADFPLACTLELAREEQEAISRWFSPHPEFADMS